MVLQFQKQSHSGHVKRDTNLRPDGANGISTMIDLRLCPVDLTKHLTFYRAADIARAFQRCSQRNNEWQSRYTINNELSDVVNRQLAY